MTPFRLCLAIPDRLMGIFGYWEGDAKKGPHLFCYLIFLRKKIERFMDINEHISVRNQDWPEKNSLGTIAPQCFI